MSYKVLLINITFDKHLQRLILNLKAINKDALIDVLIADYNQTIPAEIRDHVNNVFTVKQDKHSFYKLPIIRNIKRSLDICHCFDANINKYYDVINIHYPTFYYAFLVNRIKKKCRRILVTPWGSDVYRTHGLQRRILKRVFDASDYVCGTWNKFCFDVVRIMKVPEEKIVNLDIGSDSIDYISENLRLVTNESAKSFWGIENKYVITCGYNGSVAQNHRHIIKAVANIKDQLPQNLLLLFPMSYAGKESYFNELRTMLESNNIEYKFVTHFMSMQELINLRMSTDMFVHVQKSDANASSVQEYLLCKKKVVNGEWLRYKELEKNGECPYYLVTDLDTIDKAILDAYNSSLLHISSEVIDYIKSYGWRNWIVKWNDFYSSCKK